MNLFGKKKKKNNGKNKDSDKIVNTIQTLKSALDQISKREAHLSEQVNDGQNRAREKSRRGDRQGALFELRRKKLLENEINSMFGKRFNIESQILALESASGNQQVMAAMKQSKNVLEGMMKKTDVDEFAEVIDDTNEIMLNVEEISFYFFDFIFYEIFQLIFLTKIFRLIFLTKFF
ncbi:Charged multivesicular body protein 4C, partial [Bonamia ostreae]